MKLLIHPDVDIWNYVLADLRQRDDVQLFPLNRHCNLLQKVVRKKSPWASVPARLVVGADIRRAIRQLKPGDVIVLCEYTEAPLTAALARLAPAGVSLHLWLWNHKGEVPYFGPQVEAIKQRGFRIHTYDEMDARLYDLNWHPQFFCIQRFAASTTAPAADASDFLFVGYVKHRREYIDRIRRSLEGFDCNFTTVQNPSDYVPYADYMERIRHTRCIVEVVEEGIPSCTLRPLEAIAMHRKLLTNNPLVRQYAFYNPANIFIVGQDDPAHLRAFLESPYQPLDPALVASCDVSAWLDSFR